MNTSGERLITVFLCGDVMTGRGIDQILPNPSDPRIYEAFVSDARTYVELAEDVNGPIGFRIPGRVGGKRKPSSALIMSLRGKGKLFG
jgi:poly-gamma-glutamate synthesis protein (capsule biosynthesis protein)